MGILDDIQQMQMNQVQQGAQQQGFAQPAPAPESPDQPVSQIGGGGVPPAQQSAPNQSSGSPDQSQAGRLQSNMADYAGMLLQQAQQLSQPQGAGARFRQGFGGGMMHAAGLATPREQALQNIAAQHQALQAAVGVQQTGLQSQMVTLPNGLTVPLALAKTLAPAMFRGDVSTNNNIRTNATKLQLQQLKSQAESGNIAKWMPVKDGDGNVIMRGFSKQGQPIQDVPEAVFPWLLQNTSSTIDYQQDGNGNFVALPKTTTTQKSVPGGASASAPAASGGGSQPRTSGGGVRGIVARPVLGTDGQPLQGARSSVTERSYTLNSNLLEKSAKPVEDSLGRFARLGDTVMAKTPQADALIAPELLTVMAGGQGSGLRMNEAEISRIVGGRSNWESIKAAVNKWQTDPTKALSVTDSQREQVRSLLNTVRDRLTQKQSMIDDARQSLINAKTQTEHRQIVAGLQRNMAALDLGTSNAPTIFTDNGKKYNIFPWDKAAFLKDHPNAH